ncbi:MAG: GNAT family N-acetyltransferase [Microbacteriaceae bacterium]|nr:GNAT family N-acetyltransferase [Microbacteriaceae bacterium]MCL2795160.1 GNAT family N-acetyltransferase [Microbacteriaceae bacterium]
MSPDVASIDPTSAARLATDGLELRLVDPDGDDLVAWLQADFRGFHDARVSVEKVDDWRAASAERRTVGVFDTDAAEPGTPVATTQTWVAPLTLPGGGQIDLWSIASVTVAPTHRRRGVARALLEGELRTAAAHGAPIAGLTVSEATIYGRYGFGVATFGDDLRIDTRRVTWSGPEPRGRVHFVEPERLLPDARRITAAVRASLSGALGHDDFLQGRAIGVLGDEKAKIRTVRYDDADGVPQGFLAYEVRLHGDDFTKHEAVVWELLGATDEASSALWRFLLELDLVSTVSASGRPVDDAVLWQLGDLRAASRVRKDRLWLRILDVPRVLEARRYASSAAIVLEVEDALGFGAGRFLLEVGVDGAGRVRRLDGEGPAGAASLALTIADLSSICLGGVAPTQLARAGRIVERTPGAALVLGRAFATERAPWLILGF